jgi:hypothetical protein
LRFEDDGPKGTHEDEDDSERSGYSVVGSNWRMSNSFC